MLIIIKEAEKSKKHQIYNKKGNCVKLLTQFSFLNCMILGVSSFVKRLLLFLINKCQAKHYDEHHGGGGGD